MDLHSLPWQFADQKVQQQVPQRLQVVPSALLVAFMRCNACVASSSNQTLATFDRNVLACFEVTVSLRQAEIDDVNNFPVITAPTHEVVGLDIPMHKALSVDLFESSDDLNTDCEGRC